MSEESTKAEEQVEKTVTKQTEEPQAEIPTGPGNDTTTDSADAIPPQGTVEEDVVVPEESQATNPEPAMGAESPTPKVEEPQAAVPEEAPSAPTNTWDAIEAGMKDGKRATRREWDGLFIFMQVPSTLGEHIIPGMQSLPQHVKNEFVRRGGGISYSEQFGIVNNSSEIKGWLPSEDDKAATDWSLLDF